jgi:endoglucanase
VPACRFRGEIVQARACDDLAGAAAVLATLHRVAAERPNGHLVGLFTRAEEVGLLGASVAARERLLPEDALVVAVETSSLAGGRAEQGGGPIIRIGDAAHVFSPRMTQWMTALSTELAAEDASFRFQRKLMDGGVTEATSYDLYGYETGAACIALGNYHNAGPRGRVRAETVHLGDLEGLVRLFVRMHETVPRYERYLPALLRRYDGLGRAARTRLRGSARRG